MEDSHEANPSPSEDKSAPPPVIKEGQLSYADYLDEMPFIAVHKAIELWFRLLLHESRRVAAMLGKGDDESLREAMHLLSRIERIARQMQPQIGLLDSMKPLRFLGFRHVLEPASGFQSYQFREMEYAWGLRNPHMLKHHDAKPARRERLEEWLAQPSMRDHLGGLLRKRGFDYPAGEGEDDEAAFEARVKAIKSIYENPEHSLLEDLLEALLEVDAQVALWRRHHVFMVERQIGRKWGTGGSQGVPYLERTLAMRFFPEIWAVRTHLERGEASRADPA
ncbi:MAG: tryptophan 2,3-dioxygenase family protein [Planctomycetota bacterium]|jgi:tryptophan 2,3-dioxygenase